MFYPTHIDIGIFIGTIGLFFVFFLLFARFFPVLALNEVKTILKSSGESFKNDEAHSPAYSLADQHLAFKVSHDHHDDYAHGHTTNQVEAEPVAEPITEAPADGNIETLLSAVGKANADDKDDLKLLNGLGPAIETKLNKIGIFTLAQIAKMTKAEYDLLDELIDLRGRAEKDDWAGQANDLLNNNEN